MKRMLCALLCVLLIVSALACLTACGKKADGIVGTWKAKADISGPLLELIGNENPIVRELVKTVSVDVPMDAAFLEDGTYTISINDEGLKEAVSDVSGALNNAAGTVSDLFGKDTDLDSLLGASVEQEINEFLDGQIDKLLPEGRTVTGRYELDGDTLWYSDSPDRAPETGKKATVSYGSGSVTLKAPEGQTLGWFDVLKLRSLELKAPD